MEFINIRQVKEIYLVSNCQFYNLSNFTGKESEKQTLAYNNF